MSTLFHFYKSGRFPLQRENVSLKSFSTITNLIEKWKCSLIKEWQKRNTNKKGLGPEKPAAQTIFSLIFMFFYSYDTLY